MKLQTGANISKAYVERNLKGLATNPTDRIFSMKSIQIITCSITTHKISGI